MQKAYLFDEKTKEYKSEVNAQLDPLKSEKAGKEIYLLPANATWLKPMPKDGCVPVWNGETWDVVGIIVKKNIGAARGQIQRSCKRDERAWPIARRRNAESTGTHA